jgi:tetratricopeptide (TPR) repeat protein
MDVVASWTGSRADALRRALRMTNESFAAHLGIAVRTVAYWRERADVIPRPAMQEILDTALARAPASAHNQFWLILAEQRGGQASPEPEPSPTGPIDVGSLTSWITATNTSNAAIEHIERVASALAEMHTQVPDRKILADVVQLHRTAQSLLRGGRQRLRQTRELIRMDGNVLAHASVLLSNLGQNQAAEDYGQVALLCLQEAEADQATAWYALAKNARWQHNYAAAADLARQGLEHGLDQGAVTPMSVQLASYEANAAALLGDRARARQALARSGSIADRLPPGDGELSPWSFPAGRQAIFRLSVLLRTGDPRGALCVAEAAEDNWAAGDPRNTWTWAQVRIGAAIAHLAQGALDGTTEQIAPVLALAPDMRVTTVTGWLADLDQELARSRFAASPITGDLRQQIRQFTTGALRETG